MSTVMQSPEAITRTEYRTWLGDVRAILASMDMDMETWQGNWPYDFRHEYQAGTATRDAAVRAYDFWWQRLLAESWT